MHAFQHGHPRNLYGKDSLIHRLLLHRDFHVLFSPSKVLGIRKIGSRGLHVATSEGGK